MSGYTPPSYCVSLTGSTLCPAFAGQYINPTNLTNAWPLFANVTDVESFDQSFANYLSSDYGFRRTKYSNQLGCSNYDSVNYNLQYQTTFLCGEFSHISYSQRCYTDGSGTPPTSRETCQVTCLQFAASEQAMLQNATVCPTNTAGSLRDTTINKDFVQCTAWGTLATNDTATCILGEKNEPNCGFGDSTDQLCSMCDPSQGDVPSCCISNGTSLSSCGFSVAISSASVTSPIGASSSSGTMALPSIPTGAISPAASSFSGSASSAASSNTTAGAGAAGANTGSSSTSNNSSSSHGLSGGAIAGIVIGALVAGLVLLGLLLLCCLRRRRNKSSTGRGQSDMAETGAASHRFEPVRHSSSHTQASGPSTPGSNWSGEKKAAAAAAGLTGAGAIAAAAGKNGSEKNLAKSRTPPVDAAAGGKRASDERPVSGETNGSSDNGRNLLSSYQDQYSGATITPGSEVTAIYAYAPNLPDELRLEPDTAVTVVKLFDDGWAVGRLPSGQEGAFPLVCVTAGDETSGTGGQTTGSEDDEQLRTDRGSPSASDSAEEHLHTADGGMTTDAQSFRSARSRQGLTTGGSGSESDGQSQPGYFGRIIGR